MLETLKFVKAALDNNGHNPAFAHFRIRNGTVQANNGHLAIQAPIQVDIDCCPHGGQFLKAIAACEDVISLHLEGGKLIVRSGKFKSAVETCDPDRFPSFLPSGPLYPVPAPVLPILRKLLPFVATDEVKAPWACGVLFVNNTAIATNSICIVEHWMPLAFPVIANIPRDAITELIRLKLEPISLQVSPHAVTFHLPEGAWISSSVMTYKWPDLEKVFSIIETYTGPYVDEIGLETLLDDVSKLEGFTGDLNAVYLHKGLISTVPAGHPGTSIDCPHSPGTGIYRADQLAALRGIVDCIGFDAYPAPVPFFGGDLLRGVMVGFKA